MTTYEIVILERSYGYLRERWDFPSPLIAPTRNDWMGFGQAFQVRRRLPGRTTLARLFRVLAKQGSAFQIPT